MGGLSKRLKIAGMRAQANAVAPAATVATSESIAQKGVVDSFRAVSRFRTQDSGPAAVSQAVSTQLPSWMVATPSEDNVVSMNSSTLQAQDQLASSGQYQASQMTTNSADDSSCKAFLDEIFPELGLDVEDLGSSPILSDTDDHQDVERQSPQNIDGADMHLIHDNEDSSWSVISE